MYSNKTGKYVKTSDILNNQFTKHNDQLSNPTNGACKGICLQYTAKKPEKSGRYDAGQKRCQICEIYITIEGTKDEQGLFCKCCHYRVRGKPRNRIYKEILRNNDENKSENFTDTALTPEQNSYVSESDILEQDNDNLHKSWTDVNEDYQNVSDDASNEKKSAPVYDEVDESVKTFYEFKDFLDSIKLQANYQLVMLKELVEYGENHKGEIAESLAYFNNKDTTDIDEVKYYFDVPVYDVLLNHGFVIITDYHSYRYPTYKLNVHLNESQKIRVEEIIANKLNEYNKLHEIPENEWPNSDNRGSINWNSRKCYETFPQVVSDDKRSKMYDDTYGKIFDSSLSKKLTNVLVNSKWIWSVTPENWEILKSQNIWGSRIRKELIGDKIKSGDQVVFYVVGTSRLKGIFEFVGDWYDSPGETWTGDLKPDGSLIYVSQIQIKPIQLGTITIHSLHDKLDVFLGKSQSNRNLVLQSGNGYPSNNNKSLSENDFAIIRKELMRNRYDLSESSFTVDEKIENTVIPTSISETVETKIFNFDNGELNIQNCKVLSTDIIKKDQILTNDEIISTFKVGNMGGIRYTKRNDVIVLLSTHSDDYDDSIDHTSGFIIYTGEGKGNQELKNGNEKILNSQNTPMVYFKEVYQEPGVRTRGSLDNKYKFIGVVKFHKYSWTTEKNRKVIKFVLEIVS
jgi:predicted RNA-binding protein